MKHKFFVGDEKAKYLVMELGDDKVKVLEQDQFNNVTVEVTIEDTVDVLKIFHAGIKYGMDNF